MSQPSLAVPPPTEPSQTPPLREPAHPAKKKQRPGWGMTLLAAVAIIALIVLFTRHGNGHAANTTNAVSVAKVDREDLVEDLWLSAEFHPYQEVSLHSKVTGYLKTIAVDYGSQVKAGEKIAELEVPELADELAKARSAYQASLQDVKRAEADFTQADLIYQRLAGVSKDPSGTP